MQLIVTVGTEDLLRSGPIIKITIGNPSYPTKTATVNGLIDTGAAITLLNPRLAKTCQLIQRGLKRIRVAGNRDQPYPEFAASIHFPEEDLAAFRVHGVVACQMFEQTISCLIGRDILRYWEVTYNGRAGQFQIKDLRSSPPELGFSE